MAQTSIEPDSDAADPFEFYQVVRSIHGAISIWPTVRSLPEGWDAVGIEGARADCLAWIEANWEGPTTG